MGATLRSVASRVPPLTLLCLDAVTRNFQLYPSMDGMDAKFVGAITSSLPLDLDVLVAAPHVHDERYWRRVCVEGKRWENCQIAEHGMSWKQLFMERYVAELLEGFGAYTGSSRAHEDEFLRPPVDAKHPKWATLYPEVPTRLPPTNTLPNRERYCSRGADCQAVRIMGSPNSGWPALERLKASAPPVVQSFVDTYAWASVSAADITAARSAATAADSSVLGSLTGTNFSGTATVRVPPSASGARPPAPSGYSIAAMIGACWCVCCVWRVHQAIISGGGYP